MARAEELGRIERGRPRLAHAGARAAARQMEWLHDAARLMRSHPSYAAPGAIIEAVQAALDGGSSRVLG